MHLTVTLRPSPHLTDRSRARCPDLVFAADGREIAALRSDIDSPELPLADGAAGSLTWLQGLDVVVDEAAWLAECARVLAPGAPLTIAVPAAGALAWLDTQNGYRYLVDILKRGDPPDLTRPTGWHRHYRDDALQTLLADAGFRVVRHDRAGLGLAELPLFAILLWQNVLAGERDAELRSASLRTRLQAIDRRLPAPAIGWHLVTTATRARSEADDPSREAVNRPAPEIDHE